MNYGQLFRQYENELSELGVEPESLRYLFLEQSDMDRNQFYLSQNQLVPVHHELLLEQLMQQLRTKRPVQYITGKAYFRDLELFVDERVLIPRPETEELVDLILKENPAPALKVLDIGTGSGAIALSLIKHSYLWRMTASDLSPDALAVAKKNAQKYQEPLQFVQTDVLDAIEDTFDIIVSNPPYIAESDSGEVDDNVYLHEPHTALFAPEDGLAIYRKIAEQAPAHLSPKGKIYLEIGYKQGQVVSQIFAAAFPEKRVRVIQDSLGKDRMIVVDNG